MDSPISSRMNPTRPGSSSDHDRRVKRSNNAASSRLPFIDADQSTTFPRQIFIDPAIRIGSVLLETDATSHRYIQ